MRLGEATHLHVDTIPTGALSLDIALGVGGVPRGRVIEIYGPESSGKTTISQHIVAEAQRLGGICAFVDMEHALDPVYAGRCGVDVENLLISQPDTGEQALEITDMLVRSGAVDVVVIDSVAALTPKAEIEGDMGDSHVGLQARLMSQALRKLTANIKRSNTVVIFINQIRMKIGVMFGNPETTTGGNALKFYSTIRLDIRRIASIKEKGEVVATLTFVYDHHVTDLQGRLTRLQHDHEGVVLSAMHVHLDHHDCLEVLVLKGPPQKIQKLSDLILGSRGVKHGGLVRTIPKSGV